MILGGRNVDIMFVLIWLSEMRVCFLMLNDCFEIVLRAGPFFWIRVLFCVVAVFYRVYMLVLFLLLSATLCRGACSVFVSLLLWLCVCVLPFVRSRVLIVCGKMVCSGLLGTN